MIDYAVIEKYFLGCYYFNFRYTDGPNTPTIMSKTGERIIYEKGLMKELASVFLLNEKQSQTILQQLKLEFLTKLKATQLSIEF